MMRKSKIIRVAPQIRWMVCNSEYCLYCLKFHSKLPSLHCFLAYLIPVWEIGYLLNDIAANQVLARSWHKHLSMSLEWKIVLLNDTSILHEWAMNASSDVGKQIS